MCKFYFFKIKTFNIWSLNKWIVAFNVLFLKIKKNCLSCILYSSLQFPITDFMVGFSSELLNINPPLRTIQSTSWVLFTGSCRIINYIPALLLQKLVMNFQNLSPTLTLLACGLWKLSLFEVFTSFSCKVIFARKEYNIREPVKVKKKNTFFFYFDGFP